ncbi:hypothetical protein FG87_33170 [Nocardia vulneris]|uniref:Uncharacterized protein n=1 Tax=Nocardia vulneris TaxID=1141657 RepID=A0ABR4Z6W4_9NOCA|nr:hypothetical protein FG87_33170 [Nocardia vulneris]
MAGLMLIRLHGVRVRAPSRAVPRISLVVGICRAAGCSTGRAASWWALLGSLAAGVVAARVVAQA